MTFCLPRPESPQRHGLAFALLVWWACSLAAPPSAQAEPAIGGGVSSDDVTYLSGATTLSATLAIPASASAVPGVVVIHGSGTSDRSNPWTSAYVEALVTRGIAVLYPDKRGSGESGGEWREATFEDLADDAIAAIDILRAHPGVDAARVGVIGFSQGGHVAPIVAKRSPQVSFVVTISGSVVPMAEQIGDEVRQMGMREGLSQEELATVQDINEQAMHYGQTGEGWDSYLSALLAAKRGRLGETKVINGFPGEADAPAWVFLRTLGGFDPLPYLLEIEVPVLFLYGARDENVDVQKSVDIIQQTLGATDSSYDILLFGLNGHGVFREDAMDFIARWIADGGKH